MRNKHNATEELKRAAVMNLLLTCTYLQALADEKHIDLNKILIGCEATEHAERKGFLKPRV